MAIFFRTSMIFAMGISFAALSAIAGAYGHPLLEILATIIAIFLVTESVYRFHGLAKGAIK